MLRWPDRGEVLSAVAAWASRVGDRADVLKLGLFGSYAQGRAGVGTDVGLVIVVSSTMAAFHRRPLEFDTSGLPVPADLLIYTADEWTSMTKDRPEPLGHVEWLYRDVPGAQSIIEAHPW